jgi:hypothetical protein
MHIFTVDEFYIIKLRVLKNMLIIGNAHDSKYYHYIQKKMCMANGYKYYIRYI